MLAHGAHWLLRKTAKFEHHTFVTFGSNWITSSTQMK